MTPLFVAAGLSAQTFSGAKADNGAVDAPVPGYVGPDGDGYTEFWGSVDNVVNPVFLAWADAVVDYSPAPGVNAFYSFATEALGPVTGDHHAVVSLGDLDADQIAVGDEPGSLTLSFAEPIRNFLGSDFVIFENGYTVTTDETDAIIGEIWAELAYVEVSSDGVNFARFPATSLTPGLVGPYGSVDATRVHNLVGKHINSDGESWGTPFDLSQLEDDPLVIGGLVDLDQIVYIRMVDIPGNGSFLDSLGNPIYDGWLTFGSGGADIEAVGAVSQNLTFEEWDAGRGLDPSGNDDGDRWDNFTEYAFGYDPEKAEDTGATLEFREDHLLLKIPKDDRVYDAALVVWASEDLESWSKVATIDYAASSWFSGEVQQVEIISRHEQRSLSVLVEYQLQLPRPTGARFYRIEAESLFHAID